MCPANLPTVSVLPCTANFLASKSALDVDGIGPVLCQNLISSGAVKNPGEILSLSVSDIASLDRMGDRSAQRIHQNIKVALARPLDRFLYALGIHLLGNSVSRRIAQHCNSIDQVLALTHHQLISMDGISDKIAQSVIDGLASQRTKDIIQSMRDAGAILCQEEQPDTMTDTDTNSTHPFAGLNICVTGTLPGMTRSQANDVIRSFLGHPESDVTKRTNVLVAGEKTASQSKINKASKNGIPIWDAPMFFSMIARADDQQRDAEDHQDDTFDMEASPPIVKPRPTPAPDLPPAPASPSPARTSTPVLF